MKILAIDTYCDETAAAVTEGTKVLSNIIWSQASLHAKFGGIYPSLAKRQHEERIDFVIEKALKSAFPKITNHQSLITNHITAIAVTIGPGLAIALEVGIKKAKELAKKYNKPLIAVNHVEGHTLSVLARSRNSKFQITNYKFPALAFVASGGTTQLILVKEVGVYEIIAQTSDDALGEALDKAARMLGLGYPGGAILEKMARLAKAPAERAHLHDVSSRQAHYNLPVPMIGQENKFKFSYSGLKTAFYKLIELTKKKGLGKQQIYDLAASFQDKAFQHVERMIKKTIEEYPVKEFWFGGGVSANIELRKRIRNICKNQGITMRLPYSKKLCTDNAAMIGVVAYFKAQRKEFVKDFEKIERVPRAKIIDASP